MFRTAYNPKLEGDDTRTYFLDEEGKPLPGCEVVTEQSHKKFCDVNHILTQYDKTGLLVHMNRATAHYGDFTQVNEYRESLELVMAAQEAFAELPSGVRKRFENDPGQFMEFITNPANIDEARDMGLAEAIKVEPPVKVEVINQPPAEGS